MIKVWVTTKKGNDFEVFLPSKRVVCPACDGKGYYVNPNIDGNGISPLEFDEDPEFKENYLSGLYDVRCETCQGENVIQIVDMDKLTPKMRENLQRNWQQEAAHRRECEAERRMGA
jgi:predicted methyltransferase